MVWSEHQNSYWNPKPQGVGLQKVIRSWTLMNGIRTLVKEAPKNLLVPSARWGAGEKTLCEPGGGHLPDTEPDHAGILILDFPPLEPWAITMLFISHPVGGLSW